MPSPNSKYSIQAFGDKTINLDFHKHQPDRIMRGQARERAAVRAGRSGMAPLWWQIAFVGCFLALSVFGAAAARQIVDQGAERQLSEGLAAYKRGDYATVVRLLRPLADQGMALAQFSLGVMYANGKGVPQDSTQAANWFRKAADQGNADAQVNLGAMYAKGQGVPQDATQAVNWFGKAADQGNADAQASLGWMYATGRGVPQDFVQAVQWSLKAAQQGNVEAQLNVGLAYQNGDGVERNFVEAAKCLRQAANQGNTVAQANLSWLYANGRGVAQDDTLALMWSTLAVTGAKDDATREFALEVRDLSAAKMTPAQIVEAQRLANQRFPK